MLKPQRNLVVALLLVAIGLGGAFLSARVFVTSMENRRLAEYQKTQAQAASSTGDQEDWERRGMWGQEFSAAADSYSGIAMIYDVFAPREGAGRRAPPFAS
jgi:hypothetical protein